MSHGQGTCLDDLHLKIRDLTKELLDRDTVIHDAEARSRVNLDALNCLKTPILEIETENDMFKNKINDRDAFIKELLDSDTVIQDAEARSRVNLDALNCLKTRIMQIETENDMLKNKPKWPIRSGRFL